MPHTTHQSNKPSVQSLTMNSTQGLAEYNNHSRPQILSTVANENTSNPVQVASQLQAVLHQSMNDKRPQSGSSQPNKYLQASKLDYQPGSFDVGQIKDKINQMHELQQSYSSQLHSKATEGARSSRELNQTHNL